MSIEAAIELAVIRGADRALRRASARSAMRATQTEDGALRTKHLRDAEAWAVCANDVAALKGPRGRDPDEPASASVEPPPDAPTSGGAAAPVEREVA